MKVVPMTALTALTLLAVTTAARAASPEACADQVLPPARGPAPGALLTGEVASYRPWLRLAGEQCLLLELPLSLAARGEGVSRFPIDRYGSRFGGASMSPELRVGARLFTGTSLAPSALLAEVEADLPTGTVAPAPGEPGEGYPGEEGLSAGLRKFHARISLGPVLHVDLGLNTSHFGLGLVSNDGAHGWEPGSAAFVDPRGGDRVLRAQLLTGPEPTLGLAASFGVDSVYQDDRLLAGDRAWQFFSAGFLGMGKPHSMGLMFVRREQESAGGRRTRVTMLDVTAKSEVALGAVGLTLETEWAYLQGNTELGATVEHPRHRVRQLGGAARGSVDAGMLGGVVDFLFASGDQNPYDAEENGFRVDPNYGAGLLLFRQVMSAQTARTVGTAGDPLLTGRPAEDLERVPTRGSATNTIAVGPKLRVRPVAGLEAYGGPLFAFASVPMLDPFSTGLAGGSPRSALGGEAGRTLGTELDLGVRYRAYVQRAELTVGVEGGALAPGSAFRTLEGSTMDWVYGGRAMARWRF